MPCLFPPPGPPLPEHKTLLVKGDYHPSAPIHLCLSSVSEILGSQAILISPSRQKLTAALQHHNDEWLKLNSGLGCTLSLSSRVKIFYPPSPAHICLLLSMLRVQNTSEMENNVWINPQTTLSVPPSLVVLHEPSVYFFPDDDHSSSRWTLSSYLSLISHALSSLTFLSVTGQERAGHARFALFDSRLDQLRLPMVKHPASPHNDSDANRHNPPLETVYNYVQKYFEWVITSDQEEVSSALRKRTMALNRNDRHGDPIKSWEWWEGPDVQNADGRQATRITWNNGALD